MRPTRRSWLWSAFLASFLAMGVPYWLTPYGKLDLPTALLHPGLMVVAFAALCVRAAGTAPFRKAANAAGLAVPAAVMARVVVDGMRDPTSHNLWPFDIVIALVVGYACSLAGALAGLAVARVMGIDAEAD